MSWSSVGYNYILTIAQVFDGGFPPWRRAPISRIIKSMNTSHTTNTHKPTRTALENLRGVYKGLLIVALICAAGYIAAFGMITNHQEGFDGLVVAAGFGIVFIISAVIALIVFCVAAFNYHRRAWAVLIATPLIVIGLPIMIAMGYGNFVWKYPRPTAQERQQEQARREAAARAYIAQQIPTPTPLPPIDYTDNNILIPNFYRSTQHHRPLSSLSFKPNADFGDTFVGHKQFVMTATNRYSGQAIGIQAIYTDACAAKWQAYPGSADPDHLARLGASLLSGELLFGEYACVGLRISAPLRVGNTYISIKPNEHGSWVELAELPQLINVIENTQPTQPRSAP